MRVDVQGEGNGAVAEAIGHHFGMDARSQGDGGVGVAKVVETNARESGGRYRVLKELAHPIGVPGGAVQMSPSATTATTASSLARMSTWEMTGPPIRRVSRGRVSGSGWETAAGQGPVRRGPK